VRASAAEASLVGRRLGDAAVAREVAHLAPDGIDFGSDAHVPESYRRDASVALVRRAVLDGANTLEG
jgi:xanthine dehydrogenase iron-sulfur cluster and FAD-binding subunit A